MEKCYFYKSCRVLLIFLLCFSGMVYAQTGNSAWNKTWSATTPQKDAVMSFDLNVSEKKNLNPYNDGALVMVLCQYMWWNQVVVSRCWSLMNFL